MNRVVLILMMLISALTSIADNKEPVCSIDTIYAHARNGELWAYDALGDCYRYGKQGLQRSYINALMYYTIGGKSDWQCKAEVNQKNPDDPFAVFLRLMDYVEKGDNERMASAIDSLHKADYHSADIFIELIKDPDRLSQSEVIEYAQRPSTDPDAAVFACAGYALFNMNDNGNIKAEWARPVLVDKVPIMYALFGVELYEETLKTDSPDGYDPESKDRDSKARLKAAEYLLKADNYGCLTKQGARLLLHYFTEDTGSEWVKLSKEDCARIQRLASR